MHGFTQNCAAALEKYDFYVYKQPRVSAHAMERARQRGVKTQHLGDESRSSIKASLGRSITVTVVPETWAAGATKSHQAKYRTRTNRPGKTILDRILIRERFNFYAEVKLDKKRFGWFIGHQGGVIKQFQHDAIEMCNSANVQVCVDTQMPALVIAAHTRGAVVKIAASIASPDWTLVELTEAERLQLTKPTIYKKHWPQDLHKFARGFGIADMLSPADAARLSSAAPSEQQKKTEAKRKKKVMKKTH
jgi:hypothetical protein